VSCGRGEEHEDIGTKAALLKKKMNVILPNNKIALKIKDLAFLSTRLLNRHHHMARAACSVDNSAISNRRGGQ
jgi:hypothetical protein